MVSGVRYACNILCLGPTYPYIQDTARYAQAACVSTTSHTDRAWEGGKRKSEAFTNCRCNLNASYLSIRPSREGRRTAPRRTPSGRGRPRGPGCVVQQLLWRLRAVRPTQVGRPHRRGRIWHVAPCRWCMAWAGRRCLSCGLWRERCFEPRPSPGCMIIGCLMTVVEDGFEAVLLAVVQHYGSPLPSCPRCWRLSSLVWPTRWIWLAWLHTAVILLG